MSPALSAAVLLNNKPKDRGRKPKAESELATTKIEHTKMGNLTSAAKLGTKRSTW